MIARSYQGSVGSTMVKSTIDGRQYSVQDKPDKQEAANLLAQVRQKMIALTAHLKKTNGKLEDRRDDQSEYGTYESRTARLLSRFDPDKISEGNEDPKYTSFTLAKGEKVVFCLRSRGFDDKIHDLGMMTFVAVHEMGHIASKGVGHDAEFKANFDWLLRNAVKAGLYQTEDFKRFPRNYCGMPVTDSPLSFN